MTTPAIAPRVDEVFTDAEGRRLTVSEVVTDDPLDRHVRGSVEWSSWDGVRRETAYSCSLQTWASIWRDKTPRTPTREQIGGTG
jgi:hypothetical protein